MIEFVYRTLVKFGYTHPLHPAINHVPIGLVIGAFLFALTARTFRWAHLTQTAWHCVILALIMLLPTAVLGIMDWQHFYGGALLFPVKMKLLLAGLLLIFLALALVFGLRGEVSSKRLFVLYLFSLLTVIGLGYFGGELVYGTRTAEKEISKGLAAEGAGFFQQNCSACHYADKTATKVGPGLLGLFQNPRLPASGRATSEKAVREQIINGGDQMPPFTHLKEEEITAVINYLKSL